MSIITKTPIDDMLLPGIRALLSQRMVPLFEEQEKEFQRREAEFRERLKHIAGEIAVSVASAIAYDTGTGIIYIQLKISR